MKVLLATLFVAAALILALSLVRTVDGAMAQGCTATKGSGTCTRPPRCKGRNCA